MESDIGLIGLAVMGRNLVLNMEKNGFFVSVYNRTKEKVDDFINGEAKGKNIIGFSSISEFVNSIKKPRKIMLMVKAGEAVDSVIEDLIPFLEKGDIIIDGGNSNYLDSERRQKFLEEKGFLFIGTGVSGGEEGALNGPSIMPGGSEKAWEFVKDILTKISAKVNGEDCCVWIGKGGSGHFVKMVHNGIEYADMQMISEVYSLLKFKRYTNEEISEIFSEWNKGKLKSYLIEITSKIFKKKEGEDYLIDLILDSAGQKGTGKWTAISALEKGVVLSSISESVFARYMSSLKDERVKASKVLKSEVLSSEEISVSDLEGALYFAKIVAYAQGFELIRKASEEYGWNIDFSNLAKIWRGGCIIRSVFLDKIALAFERKEQNLLLDNFFKDEILKYQKQFRKVVSFAVLNGISLPVLSSALAYFDSFRSEKLPANLIQAQRDFFGAHTYKRIDKPIEEVFHTNWED